MRVPSSRPLATLQAFASRHGVPLPVITLPIAVLLPFGALAVRLAAAPVIEDRPVLNLFILPVVLSTYLGGFWPGLVSTMVSAICVRFFLLPPFRTFAIQETGDALLWAVFMLNGVLVSILMDMGRSQGAKLGGDLEPSPTSAPEGLPGQWRQRLGFPGRLLLALLIPVGAAAIQWLFWGQIQPFTLFMFFPAMFLSAWVGGVATSLPAALLSSLLAVYLFVPPEGTFQKPNHGFLSVMVVFLAMGAIFGRFHDRLSQFERAWFQALWEDRVRKETALAHTENLLKRMSCLAKAGGWGFEVATGTVSWTEEVVRIYDLDPADPTNTAIGFSIFRGKYRQAIDQALKDAVEFGRSFELELELVTARGAVKWVRAQGQALMQAGRVTRLEGAIQDITAWKEAESAQRNSEDRLKLFIDYAPASLAMFDQDMRYLAVSRRWRQDYGLEEAPLVGRSHYEVFPEIGDGWKAIHQRGLAGEVVRAEEDRFDRQDGSVQWLRWEVRPWRTGHGDIGGIVVFSEDITARKRAEEDLQTSQEMFASAFAENPAAIALTRLEDGKVLDVNVTWEALTGWRREEVLGKSVRGLDIWPSAEEAGRFVQELKSQHVLRGWEQAFHNRAGGTFVTQLAANLVDVHGETFVLSTLVDITQRKQAEETAQAIQAKLEAALDAMNDAVFISDAEGHFLHYNKAFATFHKYPGKEAFACTFAEYSALLDVAFTDGSPAPVSEWAVPRALRGEVATHVEYILRRRDTGEQWIGSYSFAPIHDTDGRIVGSVVTARDITEQKRIQDEIQRLNASLERRVEERTAELTAANEELGAFAYAVSHDLRAPLRAMHGFSQALVEDHADSLPPEARGYLDQIVIGAQRMGGLIEGLLTLARSTQGELVRETVDLSALAEEIRQDLEGGEPSRQVEWRLEPGLVAEGDARMLQVVLRNLLENAWKYTAKVPVARITLEQILDQGQRGIRISDNGAGFDMAYATKLFAPFQRLHRQDEFPGLGIGLATVQRIVHRHGGSIEPWSAPGQGATFTLRLPVLEVQP